MRKLTLHLIAFVVLWWLYHKLQDNRFERHAQRVEASEDIEGRDDWPDIDDAIDTLAGGEA